MRKWVRQMWVRQNLCGVCAIKMYVTCTFASLYMQCMQCELLLCTYGMAGIRHVLSHIWLAEFSMKRKLFGRGVCCCCYVCGVGVLDEGKHILHKSITNVVWVGARCDGRIAAALRSQRIYSCSRLSNVSFRCPVVVPYTSHQSPSSSLLTDCICCTALYISRRISFRTLQIGMDVWKACMAYHAIPALNRTTYTTANRTVRRSCVRTTRPPAHRDRILLFYVCAVAALHFANAVEPCVSFYSRRTMCNSRNLCIRHTNVRVLCAFVFSVDIVIYSTYNLDCPCHPYSNDCSLIQYLLLLGYAQAPSTSNWAQLVRCTFFFYTNCHW